MKKIIYYALATATALTTTFILPTGTIHGENGALSWSEIFFGISSLIFLGLFMFFVIEEIVDKKEY